MSRSIALALSATLIFSSLSVAPLSAFANQEAGPTRIDSLVGSLFSRDDARARDYPNLAPPRDLTQSNSVSNDGRIVLAQSKKQLGQSIATNTVRVDQLQEQVRQLTGQIEQLVFETQRLQEQIRIMQEDNESRFQELEGGDKRSDLDNPVGGGPTKTTIGSVIESTESGSDVDLIGNDTQVGPTGSILGQKPLDIGSAIRSNNAVNNQTGDLVDALPASRDPLLQQNGVASLGTLSVSPEHDADALYNLGYTQILNGDYNAAEESLRKFSQLYPNHRLTSSARYWLGETFYARGQFSDAVAEFSANYKSFPDGSKAPDSLLKLGLSLARLEERDAACATLAEMFNRFPSASRSLQIAAQDEQARSNCS